jgi:SAM-dependent methyltransferase
MIESKRMRGRPARPARPLEAIALSDCAHGVVTATPESIRAALRVGGLVDDWTFDALLSPLVRSASGHFWTPMEVAHRAARWFRTARCRRVLDVGCGPGKLCVVASLLTDIHFVGLEHRADLVLAARSLAARLGAKRGVDIVHGDLDAVRFSDFDGLYFYNPFMENLEEAVSYDNEVELTTDRFHRDVETAERALGELRVGATVITYYGYGGNFPDTFELVRAERFGRGRLRWWRKARSKPRGRIWIEELELCTATVSE